MMLSSISGELHAHRTVRMARERNSPSWNIEQERGDGLHRIDLMTREATLRV